MGPKGEPGGREAGVCVIENLKVQEGCFDVVRGGRQFWKLAIWVEGEETSPSCESGRC